MRELGRNTLLRSSPVFPGCGRDVARFKMGFRPRRPDPASYGPRRHSPTILARKLSAIETPDGPAPPIRVSETTLAYFQFVFAAITPLLFLGSVIGRMASVADLCPPYCPPVGGGWWSQAGAYYSGGVRSLIHPPRHHRLRRDVPRRAGTRCPTMVAPAWFWNAVQRPVRADASLAVLNTNLTTAVASRSSASRHLTQRCLGLTSLSAPVRSPIRVSRRISFPAQLSCSVRAPWALPGLTYVRRCCAPVGSPPRRRIACATMSGGPPKRRSSGRTSGF